MGHRGQRMGGLKGGQAGGQVVQSSTPPCCHTISPSLLQPLSAPPSPIRHSVALIPLSYLFLSLPFSYPPLPSLPSFASSSPAMSSRSSSKSSSGGGGGGGGGGGQSHGHNSQGNHYCTRGDSTASGGAYHYSNNNGSYYYQNSNGSTYYNNGQGQANYTPPSANPRNGQ